MKRHRYPHLPESATAAMLDARRALGAADPRCRTVTTSTREESDGVATCAVNPSRGGTARLRRALRSPRRAGNVHFGLLLDPGSYKPVDA